MKLFQRFLTPKWKNTNPDIRKQAILSLDRDDNQSIFSEIVNNDTASELRQLATKRLNNLNEIIAISTQSSDPKVRETAHKLISQILAGISDITGKHRIGEAACIKKITALDEQMPESQKCLEFIARKGSSPAIRTAAINKIDREALLGDLTIKDSDRQIRILTAEKLTQKSTLDRVLKAIKNKDKQISKIIKSKLEQLIAEEQRPKQILAKQKSLCQSMEQLGIKGLWERDKSQFDHIQDQWAKLATESALDLQSRFETASTQFQEKYQNYLSRNEARLQEEAALLPVKQEKQALLEQLHQILSASSNDATEIRQTLQALEQQWHSLQTLPTDIEQDFNTQFQDVIRSIKAGLKTTELSNKANSTLNSLHADISKLIKNSHKLTSSSVSNLEHKLDAVKAHDEDLIKLKNDTSSLISKAKSILEKNAARADQLVSSTQQLLSTLDTSLTDGELKTANDVNKKIQSSIKQLEKLKHHDLAQLKNQANEFAARLFDLNKWRSWANTPQKERLINEVEALIDSDINPKEIAFLVSKARKDWQKLGPSEQDNSQQLWEKFRTACDTAYAPCKAVFDEESSIRADNYQKRISFLNDLESFTKNANWESVNWTKVENLYQQSRQEWQNLGAVDKNKRKEINSRFTAVYATLKNQLTVEWKKNENVKQEIVDKAKALIEQEDLHAAINSAKDLQRQWKNAGRVPHHTEKRMWADFRSSCDAVFSRRDSAQKQKSADEKQNGELKNKLCNEIESFCGAPSKDINKNREKVFSLRKEIFELPPTNPKQDQQIKDRVNQALHIFELKQDASKRIEQINSLSALRSKIEFIQELEGHIEKGEPIAWESVTSQYAALASTEDSDWNSIINNRYNTLHENVNGEELSESLSKVAEDNLPTMQASTIQLEIISDIESPTEDSDERLQIQTRRLNDKMNNHNEESQWEAFINTETNWLLTGPLPAYQLASFKDRHTAVIDELKQHFPEELENY